MIQTSLPDDSDECPRPRDLDEVMIKTAFYRLKRARALSGNKRMSVLDIASALSLSLAKTIKIMETMEARGMIFTHHD